MYLIGEIQRHEERTRERSEKVKDSSIGKISSSLFVFLSNWTNNWERKRKIHRLHVAAQHCLLPPFVEIALRQIEWLWLTGRALLNICFPITSPTISWSRNTMMWGSWERMSYESFALIAASGVNTNHIDPIVMLDIRLFITIDFDEEIVRLGINRTLRQLSEEWQHVFGITAKGHVKNDRDLLLAVSQLIMTMKDKLDRNENIWDHPPRSWTLRVIGTCMSAFWQHGSVKDQAIG